MSNEKIIYLSMWKDQEKCPDFEPILVEILDKLKTLEQENSKLKAEIERWRHRYDRDVKSLEQENERIKKQTAVKRCMACGNIAMTNHGCEIMDQLKDREEMIREAIPWITDSVFPNYKNADQRIWGKETEEIKNWLEKANKITKGEG